MAIETAHAQDVRERPVEQSGRTDDCAGDVWVGVVRAPPEWFSRRVDSVRTALGLPSETTERLDRRRRDFRMQGLCADGAHNAAWDELDVDDRYRDHLSTDAAHEALASLDARVRAGQRVVLATTRRPGVRCHRTTLAAVLRSDAEV
jgi:hypothetical protein